MPRVSKKPKSGESGLPLKRCLRSCSLFRSIHGGFSCFVGRIEGARCKSYNDTRLLPAGRLAGGVGKRHRRKSNMPRPSSPQLVSGEAVAAFLACEEKFSLPAVGGSPKATALAASHSQSPGLAPDTPMLLTFFWVATFVHLLVAVWLQLRRQRFKGRIDSPLLGFLGTLGILPAPAQLPR